MAAPPDVASSPGTDDTASGVDAAAELLERRHAAIEQELTAVAGGASLCAISRSAGSVPMAKYLEGRIAALREVRRGVRAGRPLAEVLPEIGDRWRVELGRAEERSMGADWRAYRAGGVDEVDELRSGAP